jgi:hypothetical protein
MLEESMGEDSIMKILKITPQKLAELKEELKKRDVQKHKRMRFDEEKEEEDDE